MISFSTMTIDTVDHYGYPEHCWKTLEPVISSNNHDVQHCMRISDIIEVIAPLHHWLVVWNMFFPIYWEFHHTN